MIERPEDLLDGVLDLSRRAAEAILAIYAEPFDTDHKTDGTPVTRADLCADGVIRRGLAELAPHIPIVSEESPLPDPRERRGWHRLWLVDPLDGTREFVRRSDQFTVNIALVEGGRPVLGVVLAPVDDVAWYAARDDRRTGRDGALGAHDRCAYAPASARPRPPWSRAAAAATR